MSFIILQEPKEICAARNPMGIEIQADANWATFSDYYLKLVLKYETVYRSGVFTTSPAFIPGRPNPEGKVIFDIHGLLEGILSSDRPNLASASDVVLNTSMNKRYQFRIEEYKDGLIGATFDSGTKHILKAGFADDKKQYMYEWTGSLLFLTHQPRSKRITKPQPEYLTYFAFSPGTLSLRLDITYEDGTQNLNYDPGFSLFVDSFDCVTFAVSYERLGLHLLPKLPESWEIWVESDVATKPISERMGYFLDELCTPLDRFYLFENSLGGWDTIRTTGEMSFSQSHQGQMVERILSPFASTSERAIYDVNTYQLGQVIQHTGYVNWDEAMWLRDLYFSADPYRIGTIKPNLEALGDLVPIRIPPGQYKVREDNAFMEGMKFTYQEGYRNQGL